MYVRAPSAHLQKPDKASDPPEWEWQQAVSRHGSEGCWTRVLRKSSWRSQRWAISPVPLIHLCPSRNRTSSSCRNCVLHLKELPGCLPKWQHCDFLICQFPPETNNKQTNNRQNGEISKAKPRNKQKRTSQVSITVVLEGGSPTLKHPHYLVLQRDLWFRHSRCGIWQLSVNQPSGSLWSCRFYGVNSNELRLNWVTKTWPQTPKYTQVSTSYWWQWEPLTIVWEEEELESGSPGSNNQKLDFRILLAQSENIRRKWEVSESSLYMCARGSLEDGRFWKMEEDSGRFWAVYVF